MHKHFLIVGLVLGSLVLCGWVARVFTRSWFEQPSFIPTCKDRDGLHRFEINEERASYYKCREKQAQIFVQNDFAETKDLAKAFLTLLTGVLVASITFSEKIVDLNRSGWWARGLMISSWVLILVAIACCGSGLALMATASGYASYYPHLHFRQFEFKAVKLLIAAGLSFGSGLVALLVAGIISLVERRPGENGDPEALDDMNLEAANPKAYSGRKPHKARFRR
jgi:hypothetical protein